MGAGSSFIDHTTIQPDSYLVGADGKLTHPAD